MNNFVYRKQPSFGQKSAVECPVFGNSKRKRDFCFSYFCITLQVSSSSGSALEIGLLFFGTTSDLANDMVYCFWSNVCFAFQKMTWPNSTVEDSPRTLMLCTRKQPNGAFNFFLWTEPDDLVALKWCPALTPLLLLSYLT